MNQVFWEVPQLWKGDTAYILGGGPSINDLNFDLIRDKRVIGVNNSYGYPVKKNGELVEYIPRDEVDVCWYTDHGWFLIHRKWLKNFPGLKVHQTNKWYRQLGCKRVARGKQYGIDLMRSRVAWNGNSGLSAINLAVHFGCKRIVLLGFDMHKMNGLNWHTDHNNKPPRFDPFSRFMIGLPHIKRDAIVLGVEILNATPNSAIPELIFPNVTLEDII